MFKWGKSKPRDSKASFEPKTPKLTSVSLPDGPFSPVAFQEQPTDKPISNLLFRHFSPERRATISVLGSRHTPVDTSRPRAASSGYVEAPRPIRPHPSQGAYIPILEHRERAIIDPSRAPISVPSAQYLEAQIRNLPAAPAPAPAHTAHQLLNADVDYPEEKRLRKISKRKGETVQRRYPDDPEDEKPQKTLIAPALKKGKFLDIFSISKTPTSQPPTESSKRSKKVPVDFENWKGVPVITTPVIPAETESKGSSGPLKSAMKKSTTAAVPIKSAMKKESSYVTPSKAWLEVQQEKRDDEERARRSSTSRTQPPVAVENPAVYGSAAFPPTNSATPSPVETGHEYYRRRRASHASEPVTTFNSTNYIPAYVRERVEEQAREDARKLIERCEKWGESPPTHPQLEWPLVDYASRMWKLPPTPKIYFDAGFNPRIPKYAPRVKRGMYVTPLSRQEEIMEIAEDAAIYKISLVNRTLHKWPIDMHFKYQIRVVDIFRAIYDTYSQPLTRAEYERLGEDVIAQCFPAFKQRCIDGPEFMHNEERKGFLRIDLLRGHRIFKGLVAIPSKPNTFEILFDDGR
ncbi:hypothetical protein CVT25_010735 [Psilocybe cyanescens]|uniref:DUF6699 domain-containing protein n=1 Tax=Psilocybe cyanescens TaxID=93625 RepID=A0A409WJR8_PSICY|nr:hypothetical protein CVT25_010735 [Psilocybe cyanescens]